MKKILSSFTYIILSVILCFSLSACKTSGSYNPTADSTWADLCLHFEPKWFESLPEEIQAKYDAILLDEFPKKKQPEGTKTISASTPVQPETEVEEIRYTVYETDSSLLYESDTEIPEGKVRLEFLLGAEENKLPYGIFTSCSSQNKTAQMTGILALSDAQSGEYLAIRTALRSGEDGWEVEDAFSDLESGHKYTVQAIAIVDPPEGCTSSGPLYVEKQIMTAEPTSAIK